MGDEPDTAGIVLIPWVIQPAAYGVGSIGILHMAPHFGRTVRRLGAPRASRRRRHYRAVESLVAFAAPLRAVACGAQSLSTATSVVEGTGSRRSDLRRSLRPGGGVSSTQSVRYSA